MRKVKNCNTPQNKINSAMFWQKSHRLEWYLIIWHYSNLYDIVYCIRFITNHFVLWKLTGAKSSFESMFLQERNLTKSKCGLNHNTTSRCSDLRLASKHCKITCQPFTSQLTLWQRLESNMAEMLNHNLMSLLLQYSRNTLFFSSTNCSFIKLGGRMCAKYL